VITPYVSDDGDVWIERGVGPWPKIQREAKNILYEMGYDEGPMRYVGLEQDARVSDNNEPNWVHGDDDACADAHFEGDDPPEGWEPCCRTIVAHHFRAEEPW